MTTGEASNTVFKTLPGFGLLRLGEVEQFPSAFLASSEFCHPNLRVLLLKKIQRIELFDGFEFSLDFIQGHHATPLLKPLSPTTRTERFPLHSCSGFVTGVLKWDVVCEGDNSGCKICRFGTNSGRRK